MGGGQCVLSCGNPYYCIICTTCINCIINIYRRRHARPDAAFYRLTRGRYMGRDGVENALTHLTEAGVRGLDFKCAPYAVMAVSGRIKSDIKITALNAHGKCEFLSENKARRTKFAAPFKHKT